MTLCANPPPSAAGRTTPAPFGSIAERQQALSERFPRWQPRTLDQTLDTIASAFPRRPYVVTDKVAWTYQAVQQGSERVAAALVAAGVRPGDHVALLMANYPEFVTVKFGIARAGAVAVPVNFLNRRDELGYVLAQSDAVLLITMDQFRNLDYLQFLDELAPGWEQAGGGARFPRLRQVVVFPASGTPVRAGATPLARFIDGAPPWQPIAHPGPDANSDIIYTSGTTGSPKGVMLTHDQLLRAAFGSTYGRAFEDGRRILFSLPMYHVYGYVEGLLAALFVAGSIVPQLRFDAADTLRAIGQHACTDVLLIPTMTLALLDELDRAPYDLSTLHAMISSGGRSPAGIWEQIFTRMRPRELTSGYGMTEVTASTTVTRPDDPVERLRTTNGRLRDVGPAGDPSNGGLLVRYRVVDPDTGREVAPGEIGELMARGLGVTRGYYNKPEATAAAFDAEGWLYTGDLGRIDADGYLTLAGRRKESYRCGGEQVLPSEIEDLLVTHPAVLQAHVVPVPDERMGEVGVAYVVLRDQPATTAAELIAFCAGQLARFKVPRHVMPIRADDIPATPSGRARKFLLVEMAMQALGRQRAPGT
ncbi:MAG: AMP-binding protein [Rhodoferax sp.]|nr:AMP-binding protein [Rhodoferax sp.]